MGWEVSSGLGVRTLWPLLFHTPHFQPRWEGVALRFPAGTQAHPRRPAHGQAQEPGHRAHANTYTCKPGHSATARGSQGHRKCTQSFRALGTHVHTHSPGVSHTHSHVHTRRRPQLWFLREQGEREGGPGRPRAGSDPSPAPPRQASQSERGGGGGGGRHPGSRPSFPAFSQARWTSFPTCAPCGPNFSLSPPRQLPAARLSVGTRSFPAPSPGRGSVGEVAPQGTKAGLGLARARGPVGRAARRRWPGARAPRTWRADFCLPSPGQRQKSRGTRAQPCRSQGKDDCSGQPETAVLEP